MPANHPYDPRYNAKIYVPKLTEEQRLARATPQENLRSLRFRSEGPATPEEVPIPAESVTQAPAPQDSAALEEMHVAKDLTASHYAPTALEVLCAAFPEIFAPQARQPHEEARAGEKYLVSAGCIPLVPRLCLGMPSPELCSAATSTRSSPQTLRSAPPGRRSSSITVHAP